MKRQFIVLILAVFLIVPVVAGAGNEKIGAEKKVLLQAVMRQHIERQLSDGVFLYFDERIPGVTKYYPAETHPMIMKMGEYFVLCTNFRDNEGASKNVDFYMAPRGKSYYVFRTVIDNRGPLKKLASEKKVVPVD